MPMLDEDEYGRLLSLRQKDGGSVQREFAPVLAEYEGITGMRETNPMAIYHHRLSLYGPPYV
jgi:hypothetical protein